MARDLRSDAAAAALAGGSTSVDPTTGAVTYTGGTSLLEIRRRRATAD